MYEMSEEVKKTCGNCIQCFKSTYKDKPMWSCENYSGGLGMPYEVTPPYDEPCKNWSDNPKDKDKPQDAMRNFIDHFWDDDDDIFADDISDDFDEANR